MNYAAIAIDFSALIEGSTWGYKVGETRAYNLKYENDYSRDVASIGLKQLGAGYFSAVFEHVDYPDVVFKLGFRKEDSGAAYAAWCRDKHKQGVDYAIHLPNVLFMERYEKFYMVVMPKLTSCQGWQKEHGISSFYGGTDSEIRRAMTDCIYDGLNGANSLDLDTVRYMVAEARSVSIPSAKADAFDAMLDQWQTPTVQSALNEIYDYFLGVASFDLHDENWMIAEDGCIIITDPVSFTHEN